MGLTPEIEREFGQNILNFTCKLLNIQNIDVQRGRARTLTSRPILYIMRHIWQVVEKIEQDTIKSEEKKIMPVLKSFLDEATGEGLKKGRKEERQEVALKLIKSGVDLKTVLDCTGLSRKELERLQKKAA